MRWWLVVLCCALCCAIAPAQNGTGADLGVGCVEQLQMPVPLPFTRLARAEGNVTASVVLSAQASVERVTLQGQSGKISPLLSQTVEKLLRDARFSPGCGGRTVTLTFDFQSVEANAPGAQSVIFVSPNTFRIVSEGVSAPVKAVTPQKSAPKQPDPLNVRIVPTPLDVRLAPGASKDAPLFVKNAENPSFWTAEHLFTAASVILALAAGIMSYVSIRHQNRRFQLETFMQLFDDITKMEAAFLDKHTAAAVGSPAEIDAVNNEGARLFNVLEVLSLLVNKAYLKDAALKSKIDTIVTFCFEEDFVKRCPTLYQQKGSYREFRGLYDNIKAGK